MNFESLKNLDTSFRHMHFIAVMSIIGSVIITLTSCIILYLYSSRPYDRVYVIDQAQTLSATLLDPTKQDRLSEGKSHVRHFHELFFTLSPDRQAIKVNIDRALHLADSSAKRIYESLSKRGYYSSLITARACQYIEFDSIQIMTQCIPYEVFAYARLTVVSDNQITLRNLHTHCFLRQIDRSENNPHGYFIEQFEIRDNGLLNSKKR